MDRGSTLVEAKELGQPNPFILFSSRVLLGWYIFLGLCCAGLVSSLIFELVQSYLLQLLNVLLHILFFSTRMHESEIESLFKEGHRCLSTLSAQLCLD